MVATADSKSHSEKSTWLGGTAFCLKGSLPGDGLALTSACVQHGRSLSPRRQ